ncbi:amidase family protein [Mesorhizobium sp. M0114]|uniref:amidase family protein n=1 Tax=unclassified Mesorhizobium TaxID=325217 RepID=UPI00333660CB
MDIAEATARFDLLLTPVMPMVSIPHGLYSLSNDNYSVRSWVEGDVASCIYTMASNVSGRPAVSLPLFQSEQGLPIGVQVVGRFGDEATLVRVARDLEEALPWASRRPPVFVGNTELAAPLNRRRSPSA